MRLPQLKRKTVAIIALVAAVLVGAGLWTWRTWQRARDYAKVEVSAAMAWQNRRERGPQPASQVTITLKTPHHRPYADAEVFIETWTDDLATDLLIRDLRPSPSSGAYIWILRVMDELGSFGQAASESIIPYLASPTPSEIAWTVGSPVEPAPAATSMRVKGFVRYHGGQNKQSVRIAADKLSEKTVFQIGETDCVAEYRETDSGGSVFLELPECQTPPLSVRFLDDKGNDVPSDQSDRFTTRAEKRPQRINEPPVCCYELNCPLISRFGTMIVEYWSQPTTKTIPFDATLPLMRPTVAGVTSYPAGPWKVLPSASSKWCVELVPEDAWGPRASGDPTELFEVVAEKRFPYSVREARFVVKLKKPIIVVSYDVSITACRDSVGNLVFPRGPARSALWCNWTLEAERTGNSVWLPADDVRAMPDQDPWFYYQTNAFAFTKPESVEIEGTFKLKVADTLATVEASAKPCGEGKSYSIGPAQLFTSIDSGHGEDLLYIEFRGDPGLVRELTFLAPDGEILHQLRRVMPVAYTNNISGFGGREIDGKKFQAASRVRALYYTNYRHYLLPFKVTVPSKEQD